ncbi:MAG TPA: hypothetical protein VH639_24350 [Bryobacteraceae bacterium]|jgi:hypothetical protein
MNCRECELQLAGGESSASLEEHLLECAECRALARDLNENSVALTAMREDPVVEQALACNGGFSRRARPRIWIPAAVAAGLILLALVWPRHRERATPPAPAPVLAALPEPAPAIAAPIATAVVRKKRRQIAKPKPAAPEEELMVKMLTPDPDVVVYWIVEPKERTE